MPLTKQKVSNSLDPPPPPRGPLSLGPLAHFMPFQTNGVLAYKAPQTDRRLAGHSVFPVNDFPVISGSLHASEAALTIPTQQPGVHAKLSKTYHPRSSQPQ